MTFYLCPRKILKILEQKTRYKILYGGRASTKSWSVARWLVVKAAFLKLRILCTREMQNSIKDSVYRLLVDQIQLLKLEKYFIIQADGIKGVYGSEFIFKGLRHNISEIKSTEGIDLVWCEEAEKISEDSWTILIPTIRKENSEIFITFNPEDEKSPTYQRFVKHPSEDSCGSEVTYLDNPFFTETLRREMEYDKRVDYDKYEYVWLGKPKKYSQALIIPAQKVRVESFEEPEFGTQFYFGADFGFSNDPTVLVRMFIKENILYIDYEAYGVGVEIDELETFFNSVPTSREWRIIADSERPDTISHLKNRGFNIVGASKGKGSVADGIQFLRGFEFIIIHPRCRGARDNFENYKWKQDKITGEILPIPADGSDHVPDSVRYALEPYIKQLDGDFKVPDWDVIGRGH